MKSHTMGSLLALDFDRFPRTLFCRTHGEPLAYEWLRDAWFCPEHYVCDTYVCEPSTRLSKSGLPHMV